MQPASRYLVYNPKLLAALRLADGASRLVGRLRPGRRPATPPRRILLANPAHIGDVLIATAVLPPLRQAFPDAEIGMLVGSWSRHVVEGHPDVARVHVMDNFHLNRAPQPSLPPLPAGNGGLGNMSSFIPARGTPPGNGRQRIGAPWADNSRRTATSSSSPAAPPAKRPSSAKSTSRRLEP